MKIFPLIEFKKNPMHGKNIEKIEALCEIIKIGGDDLEFIYLKGFKEKSLFPSLYFAFNYISDKLSIIRDISEALVDSGLAATYIKMLRDIPPHRISDKIEFMYMKGLGITFLNKHRQDQIDLCNVKRSLGGGISSFSRNETDGDRDIRRSFQREQFLGNEANRANRWQTPHYTADNAIDYRGQFTATTAANFAYAATYTVPWHFDNNTTGGI